MMKSSSTGWVKPTFPPASSLARLPLGFKSVPLTLSYLAQFRRQQEDNPLTRGGGKQRLRLGALTSGALLGVHSGGRSPGQELGTHPLGGTDPRDTASSQESAENVFSL